MNGSRLAVEIRNIAFATRDADRLIEARSGDAFRQTRARNRLRRPAGPIKQEIYEAAAQSIGRLLLDHDLIDLSGDPEAIQAIRDRAATNRRLRS